MPSPYPSPQPVRFAVLRENAIKWQITLLVCRTVCMCVLVVQQGILLTLTHTHTPPSAFVAESRLNKLSQLFTVTCTKRKQLEKRPQRMRKNNLNTIKNINVYLPAAHIHPPTVACTRTHATLLKFVKCKQRMYNERKWAEFAQIFRKSSYLCINANAKRKPAQRLNVCNKKLNFFFGKKT